MSRKDYVSAAKVIADEVETPRGTGRPTWEGASIACENIARGLADMFKTDNSRFDRSRFYNACKLDDNGRIA